MCSTTIDYRRGDAVFLEGKSPVGIYIIKNGEYSLQKKLKINKDKEEEENILK